MLTKFRRMLTTKKGFSMLEMIAVVAVIGAIGAAIFPNLASTMTNSKVTGSKDRVKSAYEAVARYKSDTGSYPATLEALKPDYVQDATVFKDAWDRDLVYTAATGKVSSLGSDGAAGGTGDAADIEME